MRIKEMAKRLAVTVAAVAVMTGGVAAITAAPAQAAYGPVCRTLVTDSQLSFAIVPRMYIPVCYNGDRIWMNGNVSAAVNTYGYTLNGIDWAGTYNSGGNWLGAGMNYRVTAWGNWWGFTCITRWAFNAHGQQIHYDRGC